MIDARDVIGRIGVKTPSFSLVRLHGLPCLVFPPRLPCSNGFLTALLSDCLLDAAC